MFSMLRYLGAAILSCLCVGCYNSFGDEPRDGVDSPSLDITIETLHSLSAADDYFDIEDDLTLRGVVTANDRGGNFYLSFVVEQDGYAVEVLEGLNYTYVRYPVGSVVALHLDGLRLARRYGVLQVGRASSFGSYYDLDYLSHDYLVARHITNLGVGEEVEPLALTLDQLYDDSYEAMCGRLVSISGVRFCVEEYETRDRVWSGTKLFVDDSGRELGCYTSEYSRYSMVQIAEGSATMTGVLEYGDLNGRRVPFISMRTVDDYEIEPQL